MSESIKEIREKIKGAAEPYLCRDRLFGAILLAVVACASYGLGVATHIEEDTDGAISVLNDPQQLGNGSQNPVHVTDRLQISEQQGTSTEPYVGSVNSDKYHFPWCSGAQRISEENKRWFSSRDEAREAGYEPAGNCEGLE